MKNIENLRIVWLKCVGWRGDYSLRYWEPLFSEFQHLFPDTTFITTGCISSRYKEIFNVLSVGSWRWISFKSHKKGYYSRGVQLLSPAIIITLFKLKPQLIITSEFNLWTLLSTIFKFIGKWKIIMLHEGYAPTHDFRKNYFRLAIRKYITKHIDAFITNSQGGMDHLHSHLGVSASHIFKEPHEYSDVERLLNNEIEYIPILRGSHPRFLFVGQLIPRKGIKLLLDAWSGLQSLCFDPGSLWIIGEGLQKKELIEYMHKLALKNVNFIGNVNNSCLGHWYKACDVFVFPTLEDTWGVVSLEAMSLGKAILCSKYAGTSELVIDGENGFIFDPKDVTNFTKLMLKFVNSHTLSKKFGCKSIDIMKEINHYNTILKFKDIIINLFNKKNY